MKKKFSKQYHKMMKKYSKEAKEIGKNCVPWDWCNSAEFLINHLKWMKEYYTLGENVVAMEDKEWNSNEKYTRLEMIDQILNAYNAVENYKFDWKDWNTLTSEQREKRKENENQRYYDLRHHFYCLLEQYLCKLWD